MLMSYLATFILIVEHRDGAVKKIGPLLFKSLRDSPHRRCVPLNSPSYLEELIFAQVGIQILKAPSLLGKRIHVGAYKLEP